MNLRTLRTIGQGGFGRVDEVVADDGQRYALKVFSVNQGPSFPPDMLDNVRRRFVREAQIQAAIRHPNIVPVLAEFMDYEPPSFLMPLALATLGDDIQQDPRLGGRYIEALMDVIAGLETIHSMGIFHRDLKPENVLRLGTGEGCDYYAIGDFGLMSVHDTQLSALTQTGMRKGSDFYTAPEIVRDFRRASAESDIYSLGCILHDMVGSRERVPMQPIRDEGPFAAILLSCTRERPDRRFRSAAALRDALLAVGSQTEEAVSDDAARFIALLESNSPLQENEWRPVVDFVDDHADTHDGRLVFKKLTLDRIREVTANFPDFGRLLALSYAQWARDSAFNFADCDGIANRLEAFIERGPIEVQAECLMALLYMGTSHNRWYVERKFMNWCGPDMQAELAMRIAVELRADGARACQAIRHLEWSIAMDRSNLAPALVQALQEIC